MPTHSDDRLLWLAAGLGLFVAARVIPAKLQHIRQLTQVSDEDRWDEPTTGLNENAGHAINTETLLTLVSGRNHEIRSCVIKLVADQCTKGKVHDLLLADLASSDPVRRDKAIGALWLLLRHPSLKNGGRIPAFFRTKKAWDAIVTALVNLLPLHSDQMGSTDQGKNHDCSASPIRPRKLPPQEYKLLDMVYGLICGQPEISHLLSAGIVSRWLRYYPFPCRLAKNRVAYPDPDIVELSLNSAWNRDHLEMHGIIVMLSSYDNVVDQLRRYGLTRYSRAADIHGEEMASDMRSDRRARGHEDGSVMIPMDGEDTVMVGGEDTAGNPVPVERPRPNARHRPGSSWSPRTSRTDEIQRRRWRREAMVYSDGDGPLTQGNILQRESSNAALAPASNHNIEAQLAELNEEVDREIEAERAWEASEEELRALARATQSAETGRHGAVLQVHPARVARLPDEQDDANAASGGSWLNRIGGLFYGESSLVQR